MNSRKEDAGKKETESNRCHNLAQNSLSSTTNVNKLSDKPIVPSTQTSSSSTEVSCGKEEENRKERTDGGSLKVKQRDRSKSPTNQSKVKGI